MTVGKRWGRERAFADPVDVKQLEFGAGAQHERFTGIIGEEHLPSTATGEAENPSRRATPSRPCHIARPVSASRQVTMLAISFTM